MVLTLKEILRELLRLALSWGRSNPTQARIMGLGSIVICIVSVVLFSSWFIFYTPRTEYGSVEGYVKCIAGEPLANVWVVFANDALGVGGTAKTDQKGFFCAYGTQPGAFTVYIQPDILIADRPISFDDVAKARAAIGTRVPPEFQFGDTSCISVQLKAGRNRFDIDLSAR